MQNTRHHARSATTAIVAALALGSTALAAQTVTPPADPPIVQPVTSAPSAPVVIVPDTQTAPANTVVPTTSSSSPILISPVVVPERTATRNPSTASETAPVAPAATSTSNPRQAAAPAREAAAPAAAQRNAAAAAAPAAPSLAPTDEEVAFVPPAVVPASRAAAVPAAPPATIANPASPVGQTANQVALMTGLFFIVLLLGLAVITFIYLRRRSSSAAVPIIEKPEVRRNSEQDSSARTALTLETAASIAREHPAGSNNVASLRPAPANRASADSAPLTLPSTIPEKFEERDALIKQMVEAEPDKANPFRSRKARYRRARLILQSLTRKFEGREPWIDLSQYSDTWPSMARRQSSPA